MLLKDKKTKRPRIPTVSTINNADYTTRYGGKKHQSYNRFYKLIVSLQDSELRICEFSQPKIWDEEIVAAKVDSQHFMSLKVRLLVKQCGNECLEPAGI